MLKQHRTIEGESYVMMEALQLDIPAVMGGSISVTHKITSTSPLIECVEDGRVSEEKMHSRAFIVTFSANDDTYQAEISSMQRYGSEQFHFDKVFEDVMVLDEARSQPGEPPSFRVDFSKFHDVQDLAPAVFSPGGTRQTVTPSHGAYLDVKMCF